jgi:uncharacterized protein with PIN domain
VLAVLNRQLPEAVLEDAPGRVWVKSASDASPVLASLHGIRSYSPCTSCDFTELEERAVAWARATLRAGDGFRVQVRRRGRHGESSPHIAARIAARICEELPACHVDLGAPPHVLGVEIRESRCFLYDQVIEGIDHRPAAAPTRSDAPRFLVDRMLGKLATNLRLLGYDTVYAQDEADSALLRRAHQEERLLLTSDRQLASAARTLFIASRDPVDQIAELRERLNLATDRARMFSRCTRCNTPLQDVSPDFAATRVPTGVLEGNDQFSYCPSCDQIYWAGSHYQRIMKKLL